MGRGESGKTLLYGPRGGVLAETRAKGDALRAAASWISTHSDELVSWAEELDRDELRADWPGPTGTAIARVQRERSKAGLTNGSLVLVYMRRVPLDNGNYGWTGKRQNVHLPFEKLNEHYGKRFAELLAPAFTGSEPRVKEKAKTTLLQRLRASELEAAEGRLADWRADGGALIVSFEGGPTQMISAGGTVQSVPERGEDFVPTEVNDWGVPCPICETNIRTNMLGMGRCTNCGHSRNPLKDD